MGRVGDVFPDSTLGSLIGVGVNMITRVFRVRVPLALHAEFEQKFLSVSVPLVKAEPGFVSVTVGRPTQWTPEEFFMLSVWRSEADIAAFAGENWNRAVIPQGMEKYVSEFFRKYSAQFVE
ncbi:MAG: hypothetical protein B7X84_06905 [Alphaproteobacteria bacterium 17-39-52]|nr:MAG: hypothetical protein B7X84_06905 [Alphaproteobacteria bacterium 17-39-52]